MKLVYASLCFLFAFLSFMLEAQSSTVRVRLLSTSQKVNISGQGLRFQNLSQPYRPVAIPQNSQAEVRLMERAGKKFWALRVNGKDPEHLFTEKYLMIQGDELRAGGKRLPEKVLLSQNNSATVDVVGVLSLDDYLVGVLASEMPLSWPLETLKAQAVAARSYALAVMEERKDQAFHLESSVLDQVFRHVRADGGDPRIRRAARAVAETKDLKLYSGERKVLKAFFHSDCGGKTVPAKDVWKSATVNTGVAVDHSCPTNPKAHWKLALSKDELKRRLKVRDISQLELVRASAEERVQGVRLRVGHAQNKFIGANDFRQLLGFQELRSAWFTLKQVGESFVFEGQGFGHGVGLCQWGSRALGRDGMSFKQILKHYYPLAKLSP